MADFTVPGWTKPDQLENVRQISQRGKLESALLIILVGTAAVVSTTDIKSVPNVDQIEHTRYVSRSPINPLITVLSFYPADVVTGFDNFAGWPPPEPNFNQQQTHLPLLTVLTSYSAYNPAPDIIYKQFRRTPYFEDVPPFIRQSPSALLTNLTIKPAPPGDLTTLLRKPRYFAPERYWDAKNNGAWHVVLMPQLAPLPPPPTPPIPGPWPPPSTITNLPCRGAWELPDMQQALWVFGSGCFLMTIDTPASASAPATFRMQRVGTLNTSTGRVGIRDNGVGGYAVIVDGPYGYFYNIATQAFTQITDPAFLGADRVAFIDGWWIFNQPNSQVFYTNFPQYSITFSGSYFALKDGATDWLVTLFENKEELWLVGEKTTEIWYDAGGQYFPFQRLVSTMLQVGCSAKHSIARFASEGTEGLIFLGKSERGECAIILTSGFTATNVATPAVANEIGTYSVISDAIGDVYQKDGHEFYVLTFPTADVTWCYDGREKAWHKRASYDPYAGQFHRMRANAFLNFQNQELVGDYQNGAVHRLTRDAYTDAGWPLVCNRRTPHIWDGGARNRVFNQMLQIEFAPGVGTSVGLGSDPHCILTLSNDGGTTWGNQYFLPIGKIGNYRNRAIKRRISFARDRVYDLIYVEPTVRDIVGATLKAGDGPS